MIEINLLPPEKRVKKREPMKLPSLPVIPVAVGIIGFVIALQVVLMLFIQIKSASLASIKRKIDTISKSNQEAMTTDVALRDITSKVDIIDKLSNMKFNVAKKLNEISDSLVSGVWLRSLDIKKGESPGEPGILRQSLILEGSSMAGGETEEGSVGKFVNSLKDNTSFSSDFDDIELAKVERKKIRNTEVLDFVIICHFKKGKGL